MQKPASQRNHCNVLSHIQGYLERKLDADDCAELAQMIDQYRLGDIPSIVPITNLRHLLRETSDTYINQSYCM
jgi:uncharacterized protein YbgA (DUF1722 family)